MWPGQSHQDPRDMQGPPGNKRCSPGKRMCRSAIWVRSYVAWYNVAKHAMRCEQVLCRNAASIGTLPAGSAALEVWASSCLGVWHRQPRTSLTTFNAYSVTPSYKLLIPDL